MVFNFFFFFLILLNFLQKLEKQQFFIPIVRQMYTSMTREPQLQNPPALT